MRLCFLRKSLSVKYSLMQQLACSILESTRSDTNLNKIIQFKDHSFETSFNPIIKLELSNKLSKITINIYLDKSQF